jgi:serine/threonine-protein kinase RsbW
VTAEPANVHLNLSNRPENVMLVREVLTGVAEAVGLDSGDLDDIRTAVTEAGNNVVVHAYEGGEGPLEVEIHLLPGELEVVVRDQGTGIRPHIGIEDEGLMGIGLLVIQALVHRVEFKGTGGPPGKDDWDGTEVRMTFATPGARPLEQSPNGPPNESAGQFVAAAHTTQATTSAITLAPSNLARTVLPRLLCALAARAHFSTDRISDAQLVADALATHAQEALSAGYLSLAISVAPRDIELCIAPLRAGHARQLIVDSAIQGVGPVIEKLADNHRVTELGSSEMLALRMVDRR